MSVGGFIESCAAGSVVELDNVEGISVDWIGKNLYWTNDGYRKTISVARLERASQTRKTLLEGNMSHPRAIVVDPLNRSENKKNKEENYCKCCCMDETL